MPICCQITIYLKNTIMKKNTSLLIFTAGFISATILGFFTNSINKATASSALKDNTSAIAAVYGTAHTKAANGQFLTWTAFETARNGFKDLDDPTQVRGGSISKENMMEVMNAIEPGASMAFYFGKEADGKVYVMFLPAAASESIHRSAIYRNNSFCPSICN